MICPKNQPASQVTTVATAKFHHPEPKAQKQRRPLPSFFGRMVPKLILRVVSCCGCPGLPRALQAKMWEKSWGLQGSGCGIILPNWFYIFIFYMFSWGDEINMPRKVLSMKVSLTQLSWLTFNFFGDSILSRKNKVLTTFLFMALWLSKKLHLMGIWVFFCVSTNGWPLGGCLEEHPI